MAATTKTLTPTNQTISIPAFTDKPDNRLQADSTGKLADAVNALAEQAGHYTCVQYGNLTPGTGVDFTPSSAAYNCFEIKIFGYGGGFALVYIDSSSVTIDYRSNANISIAIVTGRTIHIDISGTSQGCQYAIFKVGTR